MSSFDRRHRPLVIVAVIVSVSVLVGAVGVGIYGRFFAGPGHPAGGEGSASPVPRPGPTGRPSATGAPEGLGPEDFARYAAGVLFDWDTAVMEPADVTAAVVALGDPTGEETAGLASDVAGYLPDRATWATLRGYGTAQWITIDTATVPGAWNDAVASARPGQILPGTFAYTITATRHREGTYRGEAATTDTPVTFTVFITCRPTFPECHLMRLSGLDNPLR